MNQIAPGQRWTYRTRPGEETSTALVLAVDESAGQTIISVSLDGLLIPHAAAPDGYAHSIGHLPLSGEKFRESVLELVETLQPVPREEGYSQWREAFDRGEAGVFTLTLAEIVEHMAEVLAPAPAPNVFGKTPFRP
ncbi:hypothetical protein ACFP81_02055 [Deinococcus lacus]|uniref:Uncharacterized protein n=1 Tax=Deinococcus lacus TaxID=392561 RepID=A0ABW1Y9R2_9DEIO